MGKADVKAGRLSATAIADNFSDMHPPLSRPEALIEADRCYFCYDAPCTTACPTGIDIPAFIQKIRSDNVRGSAHTILRENIMGGMCARVCPTEVLCEEACVRNDHEDKPVAIGLLQRYATDPVFEDGVRLFDRGTDSGRSVAIVGGGPAGLSCAHRLAILGHRAVIYCRDDKLGGLNEYGIAAYKTVDQFAQREVDWILAIGGIDVRTNVTLGVDFTIAELQQEHDAVFLAIGLGGVNSLGLDDEDTALNAVDYLATLRQSGDLSELPVGRRVIVIGGGMTAIDIAVQSKRLGAEQVDIVYRRGPEQMGASRYEQEFAQTSGVSIHHWATPQRIDKLDAGTRIEFARTDIDDSGKLIHSGDTWSIDADVVFKAVGQTLEGHALADTSESFAMSGGKLHVDDEQQTSVAGIWAGGDCVHGHEDLTVSAVQDGKVAAHSIDKYLQEQE